MTLRTIMPSSVMNPSTDVRPMVKSAIRSPTTAPNRHSDIEAMTTSVMPNLRKLTRMKKKMITSEIDSPDAMGGMVSPVEFMGAAQFRGDACREHQLPVDDVADARSHPHGVGTAFEVGRDGYAAHAVAVYDHLLWLQTAPRRRSGAGAR